MSVYVIRYVAGKHIFLADINSRPVLQPAPGRLVAIGAGVDSSWYTEALAKSQSGGTG